MKTGVDGRSCPSRSASAFADHRRRQLSAARLADRPGPLSAPGCRRACGRSSSGASTPEFLEQAQDDATLLAIDDMERAGVDIITDGEIRRESYSNRFATALEASTSTTRARDRPHRPPEPGAAGRRARSRGAVRSRCATSSSCAPTRPADQDHAAGPVHDGAAGPERLLRRRGGARARLRRRRQRGGCATCSRRAPTSSRSTSPTSRRGRRRRASSRRGDQPRARRDRRRRPRCTLLRLRGDRARAADGGYPFLAELAAASSTQISIEAAQPQLDLSVLARAPRQDDHPRRPQPRRPRRSRRRGGRSSYPRRARATSPPERLTIAPGLRDEVPAAREVAFGKLDAMVAGAASSALSSPRRDDRRARRSRRFEPHGRMRDTHSRAVVWVRRFPERFLLRPARGFWLGIALLGVVVLMAVVVPAEPLQVDRRWSEAMLDIRIPFLTDVALVFNWLGRGLGSALTLSAVGIALFARRRWLALLAFGVTEAVTTLSSTFLKILVGRPRPPDESRSSRRLIVSFGARRLRGSDLRRARPAVHRAGVASALGGRSRCWECSGWPGAARTSRPTGCRTSSADHCLASASRSPSSPELSSSWAAPARCQCRVTGRAQRWRVLAINRMDVAVQVIAQRPRPGLGRLDGSWPLRSQRGARAIKPTPGGVERVRRSCLPRSPRVRSRLLRLLTVCSRHQACSRRRRMDQRRGRASLVVHQRKRTPPALHERRERTREGRHSACRAPCWRSEIRASRLVSG